MSVFVYEHIIHTNKAILCDWYFHIRSHLEWAKGVPVSGNTMKYNTEWYQLMECYVFKQIKHPAGWQQEWILKRQLLSQLNYHSSVSRMLALPWYPGQAIPLQWHRENCGFGLKKECERGEAHTQLYLSELHIGRLSATRTVDVVVVVAPFKIMCCSLLQIKLYWLANSWDRIMALNWPLCPCGDSD